MDTPIIVTAGEITGTTSPTNTTTVDVTPGFPYAISFEGAFTNIAIEAAIPFGAGTKYVKVVNTNPTATGTYIFQAVSDKIRLIRTGGSGVLFYHVRLNMTAAATGGPILLTW
jgi:hypothetical protein